MIRLRTKLLLPIIVVYVIFTAIIHFVLGPDMIGQKRLDITERETEVLKSLAPGVASMLAAGDLGALYYAIDTQLSQNRDDGWWSIELFTRDGKRIYPLRAAREFTGSTENKVTIEAKVEQEGNILGALVLTTDVGPGLDKASERIDMLEWIAMALFGLLVAVAAFLQNIWVSRPLDGLTRAATEMAEGDFYAKLPPFRPDEIGQLTRAFELMRHNLLYDTKKRERAEADLRQAHDSLEQHVQGRTRELEIANRKLNDEIVDHQKARERLRLTATVFDNTSEAIIITDKNSKIVDVNHAFSKITGYEKPEVMGKNPNIQQSGRHDKAFYQAMWESIQATGHWKGEIWDKRKNGKIYPKWLTINTVLGEDGEPANYVGIFSDISDVKAAEQKLEKLAYYDVLTGCPNRYLFKERLTHELSIAKRTHEQLALLFIDLDRFKDVNDTLGHKAGDELLQLVARRLISCVREEDTVARMGGDEFTIIINRIQAGGALDRIAQNMLDCLQEPVHIEGHEVFVGGSIGITICPDDSDDFETLVKYADMAMYRAKEKGRGLFEYFHSDMNIAVEQRVDLEANLRRGLIENEFELHYQPKISIGGGRIVGMEALVRWNHNGELLPPKDFIPFCEENGFIVPLGNWVLKQACQDAKRWIEKGHAGVRVAVNVSAVQFEQDDLADIVSSVLEEVGLAPQYLEVEVTESVVMGNVEHAGEMLGRLSDMGVTISIDDFGVGYSSLSYLKRLPIDTIKIDKTFIQDIGSGANDSAIVSAIVSMAHDLSMNVLAEGVETEEQLAFLTMKLCPEIQGYIFSSPLPITKAIQLMQKQTPA